MDRDDEETRTMYIDELTIQRIEKRLKQIEGIDLYVDAMIANIRAELNSVRNTERP